MIRYYDQFKISGEHWECLNCGALVGDKTTHALYHDTTIKVLEEVSKILMDR